MMKKTAIVMMILSAILLTGIAACVSHGRLLHPEDPAFARQAPAAFQVRLETSRGEILLEVRREWSPHGADRFYDLVKAGYYDDATIFRIKPGIWAQFGIAADPAVAQAWQHRNIPDDPRVLSNARGTVAYAFKDANGRTSQVFINLRDNSATHDTVPFVPFARVVSGMDVADSLYSGYGEKSGGGIRAGHQDSLFAGGNAYLRRNFQKLDMIRRARVVD